jgi:hypothetical protein
LFIGFYTILIVSNHEKYILQPSHSVSSPPPPRAPACDTGSQVIEVPPPPIF